MTITLPCRRTVTSYVSWGEIFFFRSQSNPTIILKIFFENELVEAYMWHLHSIMSMFHTKIQEVERKEIQNWKF
jgi:hypothetical protein